MKTQIAGIFCFLAGILSVNLFASQDAAALPECADNEVYYEVSDGEFECRAAEHPRCEVGEGLIETSAGWECRKFGHGHSDIKNEADCKAQDDRAHIHDMEKDGADPAYNLDTNGYTHHWKNGKCVHRIVIDPTFGCFEAIFASELHGVTGFRNYCPDQPAVLVDFLRICEEEGGQVSGDVCSYPESSLPPPLDFDYTLIDGAPLTRNPDGASAGTEKDPVQEAAAGLGIAQASYTPAQQISPSAESRLPEYAAPAALIGALAFSSFYPDYKLDSSFNYSGVNGSLDWEAGMRGDFHHGSFRSYVSAVQSDSGFTIHSGTTYRSDSFLASYTTVEAKDYMNYNVQLSAPWKYSGWNISPNLSSEFHYDRDENHSSSESGAGLDLEYRF